MDSYDLGARIRAARLRLGMQQQDLAAHLQTTAATVSRYERGEHEPRPSDLVRLARVLSVPASYLLGETELITHDGTNDEIARRLAAMAPAEIGKRIRQARERRGKTQADIARACGVSASLMSKWESGARLPEGAMAIMLTRALGESIDVLWGGNVTPTADPVVIAESLASLDMALWRLGDIEPLSISGLRRLISIVSQGGAVGCQDPVAFWEGELRAIREMG